MEPNINFWKFVLWSSISGSIGGVLTFLAFKIWENEIEMFLRKQIRRLEGVVWWRSRKKKAVENDESFWIKVSVCFELIAKATYRNVFFSSLLFSFLFFFFRLNHAFHKMVTEHLKQKTAAPKSAF